MRVYIFNAPTFSPPLSGIDLATSGSLLPVVSIIRRSGFLRPMANSQNALCAIVADLLVLRPM